MTGRICRITFTCIVLLAADLALAGTELPNLRPFPNAGGAARTFSLNGRIDTSNPFFQSLGTNGRACVSCHDPSTGFTITPAFVRARFEVTGGLDPIFRTNDGSDAPDADVSTINARRAAYGMLLRRGLIRVGLPVPADAEFELAEVDDPYGYASASELSLFRRPLPTTNMGFLSAVMWDGRETLLDPGVPDRTIALDLRASLRHQANSATRGHAQSAHDLSPQQLDQIIDFQAALYSAQARDRGAGSLHGRDAMGGPVALSGQPFFLGINDSLGHNPTGAAFTPLAFTAFDGWTNSPSPARRAIARGQVLFNTKPIAIRDVGGLNDDLHVEEIPGTCTTCHDTPNVGNHSAIAPLNIGLSDASRRTPDMPLYTLRNKSTGDLLRTTDPGRALISGKWEDIGRFKGPVLRNLAARPPYFHNGFAATLAEVVDFYDTRFEIEFTRQEKKDLVAFLRAL